jgi:hypothetical protein
MYLTHGDDDHIMKISINVNGNPVATCARLSEITVESVMLPDGDEKVVARCWTDGKKPGIDDPTITLPLDGTRSMSIETDAALEKGVVATRSPGVATATTITGRSC